MSCTLCNAPIDEYPLWGIDFPNNGPVHDECADLDYPEINHSDYCTCYGCSDGSY